MIVVKIEIMSVIPESTMPGIASMRDCRRSSTGLGECDDESRTHVEYLGYATGDGREVVPAEDHCRSLAFHAIHIGHRIIETLRRRVHYVIGYRGRRICIQTGYNKYPSVGWT